MMEANGFEFSLGETGIGSGGTFAVGQFQRDDRILAFSVRYGLGLVEYKVGQSRITHEDFLRYSGAWGNHAYPNFGGTIQAPSRFLVLRMALREFVEYWVGRLAW